MLAAGDGGPRQALAPLAAYAWNAPQPEAGRSRERHWLDVLSRHAQTLLVCGTSDSPAGRGIEAAARRAARKLGVSVAAIEDFPGSYFEVAGGSPAAVYVESRAAASLLRPRLGPDARLVVMPSPRYDKLRARAGALRKTVAARAAGHAKVLWAGQPEARDCERTLRAVLPALRRHGASLLFRAHPRDAAYSAGRYASLLDRACVRWQDVTAVPLRAVLLRAPRLVVTQFSSVAVEAGFYGIPSVSVLLEDAGGARLLQKKGYAVPPYCARGAAAFALRAEDVFEVLQSTLQDPHRRTRILRCFDAYFDIATPALPRLIASLSALRRAPEKLR